MASNTPDPWDSDAFVRVSKDQFYAFIKADNRDIMPQSVYRHSDFGGIYSVWKTKAGLVIGYTYSAHKILPWKDPRYVLSKEALETTKGKSQ